MGAWGARIFENDDALDFIADFEEDGAEAVKAALDAVIRAEDYFDRHIGAVALAAAALVAGALGVRKHLNSEATKALTAQEGETKALSAMKAEALEAVDAIMSRNSELMEMWSEAEHDDFITFKNSVANLKSSLKA